MASHSCTALPVVPPPPLNAYTSGHRSKTGMTDESTDHAGVMACSSRRITVLGRHPTRRYRTGTCTVQLYAVAPGKRPVVVATAKGSRVGRPVCRTSSPCRRPTDAYPPSPTRMEGTSFLASCPRSLATDRGSTQEGRRRQPVNQPPRRVSRIASVLGAVSLGALAPQARSPSPPLDGERSWEVAGSLRWS